MQRTHDSSRIDTHKDTVFCEIDNRKSFEEMHRLFLFFSLLFFNLKQKYPLSKY